MTILPKHKNGRKEHCKVAASDRSSTDVTSSYSESSLSVARHRSSSGQPAPAKRVRHERATLLSSKSRSPSRSASPKEPHNSDDESTTPRIVQSDEPTSSRRADELITMRRLEEDFVCKLKQLGYTMNTMVGDGACMFRAIADQIWGDQEMHDQARKLVLDYIVQNRDHYSGFITEDFDAYIARKRILHVHGNHVELQAAAEIFARPVHVYEYSSEPMNIFQPTAGSDITPLRLSYHSGTHYNSIINPKEPTVGVGLGLPGYKPGEADARLVSEAAKASETTAIEETMLKDKLATTDWEATEKELEREVERASYREWLSSEFSKAPAKPDADQPATSTSTTAATADAETGPCPVSTSQSTPCTASEMTAAKRNGRTGFGFGAMQPTTSSTIPTDTDALAQCTSPTTTTNVTVTTNAATTSNTWSTPPRAVDDADSDMLQQVLELSRMEYINAMNK